MVKYDGFFSFAANTIQQGKTTAAFSVNRLPLGSLAVPARRMYSWRQYTRHAHRGPCTPTITGSEADRILSAEYAGRTPSPTGGIFNNSTYKYYDEYDAAQDSSFLQCSFPAFCPTPWYPPVFKHRKLENSLRLATFKLDSRNQERAKTSATY